MIGVTLPLTQSLEDSPSLCIAPNDKKRRGKRSHFISIIWKEHLLLQYPYTKSTKILLDEKMDEQKTIKNNKK